MHKVRPFDPDDPGANYREFAEAVGRLGDVVGRNREAALAEIDRRKEEGRKYREYIESLETVEVEGTD